MIGALTVLDAVFILSRFFIHLFSHSYGYYQYFAAVPYESGWTSQSTAMDIATKLQHKVKGTVSIVTGSTGGIGLETVVALAANGGTAVMCYRSDAKRERAMKILEERGLADHVIPMKLELSDFDDIQSFVDEFETKGLDLHYLINNAGVMRIPERKLTKHGHEMQIGVNHFGHFYLTQLLTPFLEKTAKKTGKKGRIVNVSSLAQLGCPREGIVFDNLSLDQGRYVPILAYGHSKLANVLHALHLNKMFREQNVPIVVNSCHPGMIPTTELARHTGRKKRDTVSWPLKNMEQGAATQVYFALDDTFDDVGGMYGADSHIDRPLVGFAYDEAMAQKLYEVSVEEVKRIVG